MKRFVQLIAVGVALLFLGHGRIAGAGSDVLSRTHDPVG